MDRPFALQGNGRIEPKRWDQQWPGLSPHHSHGWDRSLPDEVLFQDTVSMSVQPVFQSPPKQSMPLAIGWIAVPIDVVEGFQNLFPAFHIGCVVNRVEFLRIKGFAEDIPALTPPDVCIT